MIVLSEYTRGNMKINLVFLFYRQVKYLFAVGIILGGFIFTENAWAVRKAYTTTGQLISEQMPSTPINMRGVVTRAQVELINLSNVVQTATVRIMDYDIYQTVDFDSPASAVASLSAPWLQNTTYPDLMARGGIITGIPEITLTIPANGKRTAYWSINCKVENNALASACFFDESLWSGYTVPYINHGGRQNTSMRFSIEVTEDRGALLGSYAIEQYVALNANNGPSSVINREINGGRPF